MIHEIEVARIFGCSAFYFSETLATSLSRNGMITPVWLVRTKSGVYKVVRGRGRVGWHNTNHIKYISAIVLDPQEVRLLLELGLIKDGDYA